MIDLLDFALSPESANAMPTCILCWYYTNLVFKCRIGFVCNADVCLKPQMKYAAF
jgi:hypothetical protein